MIDLDDFVRKDHQASPKAPNRALDTLLGAVPDLL